MQQNKGAKAKDPWEDKPHRPLGGKRWRCNECGGPLTADCECCAPPPCNCKRGAR